MAPSLPCCLIALVPMKCLCASFRLHVAFARLSLPGFALDDEVVGMHAAASDALVSIHNIHDVGTRLGNK